MSSKLPRAGTDGGHLYDGPAFESTSEDRSERFTGPVDAVPQSEAQGKNIGVRMGRKESRKPWEPPFPTTAKTVKESTYRILPSVSNTLDRENTDKEGRKGNERKRAPTLSSPDEKEEDIFTQMGHVPVTEMSAYGAPLLPPSFPPPLIRSPTPVQSSPQIGAEHSQDQKPPVHIAPEPTRVAHHKGKVLSVVQITSLIMACIVFLFAFAVLVAHCMAWLVVYKTEARLGEMRKGLLQGGDMRVCLCPR